MGVIIYLGISAVMFIIWYAFELREAYKKFTHKTSIDAIEKKLRKIDISFLIFASLLWPVTIVGFAGAIIYKGFEKLAKSLYNKEYTLMAILSKIFLNKKTKVHRHQHPEDYLWPKQS